MGIRANQTINQGTSFSTEVIVSDDNGNMMDLLGYTAQAQMRKYYTSNSAISFATEISVNDGSVILSMSPNTTVSISPGRYVYDCNLIDPNGTVTRLIEGIVTVTPGVTR